jgi:hypothetical protein
VINLRDPERVEQLKQLLSTTMLQGVLQVLTFIAGIVVIRLLAEDQYAYYTIANATLGTLAVLTDSGISQWVMSRGGSVWQDRGRLGAVIACAMLLRRRFALIAGAVALPVLCLLLLRQGASWQTAMLVCLSILPLFISTLTGQLYEAVGRLHQVLWPLQRTQLLGMALRVVLSTGALLLLPFAWIASVAAGLAQMWVTVRQRAIARDKADLRAAPDHDDRINMRQQVARIAPGAVYYAFSGQINIWIISIFGTSQTVAQVGALGRLAMVFNVLMAVISLVLVPRFARLPAVAQRLRLWFWRSQVAVALVLLAMVLTVAAFPEHVLWVLGPRYASLQQELLIAVVAGALALQAACAYMLSAARGIVINPVLMIPAAIAMQVLLTAVLPVSTTAGVLWLGLLVSLFTWLMQSGYFAIVVRAVREPSV